MYRMRSDKSTALALRRSGKSYNFISSDLNIPKSTLSEWFSKSKWSKTLSRELNAKAFERNRSKFQKMNEANKKRWELWRENARKEAVVEFKKYKDDILFCAGIMIYWGEGDKNPKLPVRISNTDPELLKIFTKFLKKFAPDISHKIKAHVILYPDLNETECKAYWSSRVGIGLESFYKTQHIIGRHKTRRIGYGIGAVTVSSGQLKQKILKWIESYSKM